MLKSGHGKLPLANSKASNNHQNHFEVYWMYMMLYLQLEFWDYNVGKFWGTIVLHPENRAAGD